MKIGVLALQGDYEAHERILEQCAVEIPLETVRVRDAKALEVIDGLILPGGESTTMSRLCERYELWQPLHDAVAAGLPLFGTCAGMILMARNLSGQTRNFTQRTLGVLDVDVARNAYGSQLDSFETTLQWQDNEPPLNATFIRAPRLTRLGNAVQVLVRHDGEPVAVHQGLWWACAFHPEIAGETRLHRAWLRAIMERSESEGNESRRSGLRAGATSAQAGKNHD